MLVLGAETWDVFAHEFDGYLRARREHQSRRGLQIRRADEGLGGSGARLSTGGEECF